MKAKSAAGTSARETAEPGAGAGGKRIAAEGRGNGHHALRRADLAYVALASSEIARDINRDVVLELVRSRQPLSRVDLARASGLQKSTVSAIVEQLIDEGWIVEGGRVRKPRGRRPTLLSLSEEIVMLAVDLLPTRAIVAVVDLNSRLLARETVALPGDPRKAVPLVAEALHRMRALYPEKTFEGVGLSVPGRVDPETRKLVLAPNLRWAGYDLAGEIEQAVGLKVEMENEANACMVAEIWSGRLDGVRNAVLVAISEGIGTAILANGQMITGWGGLAGEFGHVTLDPAGPLCGCGRLGCWETFASTRAALRHYEELSGNAAESVSPQELFALADEGDSRALAALRRQAEYLAKGLHAVVAALAPEAVLFAGDVTAQWALVGPIVEEGLAAQIMAGEPPRVMTTANPESSRLRGAAALVLQRHSGYHRIPTSR